MFDVPHSSWGGTRWNRGHTPTLGYLQPSAEWPVRSSWSIQISDTVGQLVRMAPGAGWSGSFQSGRQVGSDEESLETHGEGYWWETLPYLFPPGVWMGALWQEDLGWEIQTPSDYSAPNSEVETLEASSAQRLGTNYPEGSRGEAPLTLGKSAD